MRSKPDMVGLREIADRLQVRERTVVMWRYRGLLPEPVVVVGRSPAWDWPTIEKWAFATERLPERKGD